MLCPDRCAVNCLFCAVAASRAFAASRESDKAEGKKRQQAWDEAEAEVTQLAFQQVTQESEVPRGSSSQEAESRHESKKPRGSSSQAAPYTPRSAMELIQDQVKKLATSDCSSDGVDATLLTSESPLAFQTAMIATAVLCRPSDLSQPSVCFPLVTPQPIWAPAATRGSATWSQHSQVADSVTTSSKRTRVRVEGRIEFE